MKVIECGENDLCNMEFKCPECDCESIEEWMKFCPLCGREITSFAYRCCANLEDHDREFYWVQCDLETDHEGNHQGVGMDDIKVEWDEEDNIVKEELPEGEHHCGPWYYAGGDIFACVFCGLIRKSSPSEGDLVDYREGMPAPVVNPGDE